MPPLRSRSEQIFALTRLVVGLNFAVHGAQKLFGIIGRDSVDLLSQLGLAGVIEFLGGGMIALGLLTPWVAFVASGQMAVAYFTAHAPRGFWPIANAGEPAVLYCFVFLYFASRGSGPLSLDRFLGWHDEA